MYPMKFKTFYSFVGILMLSLLACMHQAVNREITSNQSPKKPYSPIEGNWEMVSNEKWGQKIDPKRPQQIKIFNDGYFCFMMYDSLGKFYASGAGSYEINGNMYKETFDYYSNTKYVGSSDWQEWKMTGDTLIFYGFKKAIMPDGSDVTNEWGRDKFIEKRVRVKKR
jgi:hypothetical protein